METLGLSMGILKDSFVRIAASTRVVRESAGCGIITCPVAIPGFASGPIRRNIYSETRRRIG
jgi:hypothetical protein